MSAFENAKAFVDALESFKGWEGCRQYVVDGAPFSCQASALADVTTVEGYAQWVIGFGTVIAPGATYDTHAFAWDDERNVAVFVATYNARHTGEGGPVPPTNKEAHSEYVYTLFMNDDGKVERVVKIWNDGWAMKQLGWA